jgi:hypothetical protein
MQVRIFVSFSQEKEHPIVNAHNTPLKDMGRLKHPRSLEISPMKTTPKELNR